MITKEHQLEFIAAIMKICKSYEITIEHEDYQGSFILNETGDLKDMEERLKAARDER